MVKKTVELVECDLCGRTAQRYSVTYPEGIMHLDRCSDHDNEVLALKGQPGTWVTMDPGRRRGYHKSTLEDIRRQQALTSE